MISFMLNDQQIDITEARADLTLLNYLRDHKNLKGTKEGCASGDCGACTVVVAELDENENNLEYKSINSCVTFLSAIHGKQLITIEYINDGKSLHPVQQQMVEHHGSQCGFCTPGFVMSMFAFYHQPHPATTEAIEHALSGNLCRCTGYRPIIDATKTACSSKTSDKFDLARAQTVSILKDLQSVPGGIPGLYIPKSRKELAELREAFPEARLAAGTTDLALEVTQHFDDIEEMISLSSVPELNALGHDQDTLIIGAAATLATVESALIKDFPELKELVWRFASLPIRNQATLGGNVANASPIGDMPPVLLALEATIIVDNGESRRNIPANDFFTGYRQTLLNQNEWIEAIRLPKKSPKTLLRAYKVSKRHEDDISAVCAVFKIELEQDLITKVHSGFGGVAALPVNAPELSRLIVGKPWSDKNTMNLAKKYLSECFEPIDDVRATADYRKKIVANLWYRFWLETSQQSISITTRIMDHA